MHAANAPTPGTTSPSAASAASLVGGQLDLRAGPLERADGGAQVPRAVVEDDDAGRGAQSRPLVDGTPVSRGSSATASRNARAKALNCVSTRWCGSRPASTRTCSAMWAWKASVSKTWRVSEPSVPVAADRDVRLALGLAGVHAVGAPGHVDDGLHQRLVERHGGVAEAADAALVAERLAQRLAEHDRGVLDRVVGVDVGVALGLDGQVDQRVPGERGEHVVVEADAGRDVVAAGAVEVDLDEHLGLAGLALDPCCPAHACRPP